MTRITTWGVRQLGSSQFQRKTRSNRMNLFKHNMGKTDRIIRAILGVLLIGSKRSDPPLDLPSMASGSRQSMPG
jgi:hypothetical protein